VDGGSTGPGGGGNGRYCGHAEQQTSENETPDRQRPRALPGRAETTGLVNKRTAEYREMMREHIDPLGLGPIFVGFVQI
jgi:hypothetical protein